MDDWPETATPQTQGWVIPESLLNRQPGPAAGAAEPADELPSYSQPLAYSQAPSYGQPQTYGQPPSYGQLQNYGPPTGGALQGYAPPANPGQSGYLPGGPAVPPWMTAQPVKRNRLKVVAIVCATVVAGLLVLATVLGAVIHQTGIGATSAAGHTLTLPASTGSYVRITTGTASQLGTDLAQQVKTSGAALWTKPLVGIYGNASATAPSAVFIGGDGASNPRLRSQLARSSPGLFIDGFMAGAQVPQSTAFPAGKFGGALRCGVLNTTETACVWADRSTVGTLILINPPSLSDAANTALAFRDAAEH